MSTTTVRSLPGYKKKNTRKLGTFQFDPGSFHLPRVVIVPWFNCTVSIVSFLPFQKLKFIFGVLVLPRAIKLSRLLPSFSSAPTPLRYTYIDEGRNTPYGKRKESYYLEVREFFNP